MVNQPNMCELRRIRLFCVCSCFFALTAIPDVVSRRPRKFQTLLDADAPHYTIRNGPRRKASMQIREDLPSGWTKIDDPLTHQSFYFEGSSGVSTWTFPNANLIGSLPECTADMVKSAYTRCDPTTSTKSLAFFHTTVCKGGAPLPPTVTFLPCNSSCNPGQYLPLGKPTCEPCAAGTYSVGGGTLFTNWEKLPVGMSTFCRFQLEADRLQPCTAWVLNGTYIDSGNMRGKRLMDSVLEYKVDLLRAGMVMFEFRVDAERRWDGLSFLVDGVRKMDMVSYQFQYTQVRVPLDVGFHTLQWAYHKDVAYEMGEDKAWIRSIEVLGTQANVDSCNVCPAGRFSEKGSPLCSLCPTNTYADKSGSGECKPCNPPDATGPHQFSYPGATACKPSSPCVEDDIAAVYGPCDEAKGTRTKRYQYKQPQVCHGGAEPGAEEEAPCALCDPGMFRQGSACEYCPPGTFNPNSTARGVEVCRACAPGLVARKVDYFHRAFAPEQFQRLVDDGVLTTGCANGFCGQGGWRPLGDAVDTGVGNGQVADIWLALQLLLEVDGEVVVRFRRRAAGAENLLQMYVDDRRLWGMETMQAMADDDEPLEYRAAVPAGEHVVTWVFHKEREYNWADESAAGGGGGGAVARPEDRAVITEVLVTGVEVGGAVECGACAAGQYADDETAACAPCPPGTFAAAAAAASCAPCPAGRFAPAPGAMSCLACGSGTTSQPGASACDVSPGRCRFQATDEVAYDVGGLARAASRPSGEGRGMWRVAEDNASMAYYLNPCTTEGSNLTCRSRGGAGVVAYACQQATLVDPEHGQGSLLTVSLGDVMAFYPLPDGPADGGLVLAFEGGTPCADGRRRALNVTMVCDRSAGPGAPSLPEGGRAERDKCRYALVWRSQYACPLCTERDMLSIPGECSLAGRRPVSMAWREPKRCFGGMPLPEGRSEACVAVVLDRTKVALIALGGSGVFLLLCLSVVFLYVRNRKIYREYTVLKEQNEADMELERYTLDEEEG